MKRIILFVIGFLLLILGGVGLFIPVLPTTPFVIGAATIFSGINPKIYNKLKSSNFFGEYISCYQNKEGISFSTKLISIIFLWVMLLITILIKKTLFITTILFLIGFCVTAHILLLPKKKPL